MPRRIAAPVAVLLGCVLAAWLWWEQRVEAPMRAPNVTAEAFDDFAYHYPMFRYGFEEARHGRLAALELRTSTAARPFLATAQHLLLLSSQHALSTVADLLGDEGDQYSPSRSRGSLHLYPRAKLRCLRRIAALTAGLIFAFSPVVTNNIYIPIGFV